MGMPPGQMPGGLAGQQQFGGVGYTLQQQQQQQRHQQEMMMRAQQIQMQQKIQQQQMQQQKMLMQQQQRRGQGGSGVSSEGVSANGTEAAKGEAVGKLTEDQLLILDMEARDKALQKKAKQWSALAGRLRGIFFCRSGANFCMRCWIKLEYFIWGPDVGFEIRIG